MALHSDLQTSILRKLAHHRLVQLMFFLAVLCITYYIFVAKTPFKLRPNIVEHSTPMTSSGVPYQPLSSPWMQTTDNDVTDLKLTPLLEKFDSVVFTRPSLSPTTDVLCSDIKRPHLSHELFLWQPVPTVSASAYVFSAFYDRRWNPAVVVIIGLASEYSVSQDGPRQLYCRMWFPGQEKSRLVAAAVRIVPETHGRKYAVALYTCPVSTGDSLPPNVVSLVSNCSDLASNVLKVIDTGQHDDVAGGNGAASGRVVYTVCIAVLHSNYSDYRQFVETVELNRMFGAERIVVYDMSSSADIQLVLSSYQRDGIVEIVPWNSLPLTSWPEWPPRPGAMDVHYFAQVAALNDCLYRSLSRSTFVVFTDSDEIVVPRDSSPTSGSGWTAMLDRAVRDWSAHSSSFPGVFVLRNVFFRPHAKRPNNSSSMKEWLTQTADNPEVECQLTVEREDYVYQHNIRSKYFVWSKAAVVIGIHFPYGVIDNDRIETVYVDERVGLLHHYRPWSNLDNPSREPKIIVDRWMDRYNATILRRIQARKGAILNLLRTDGV